MPVLNWMLSCFRGGLAFIISWPCWTWWCYSFGTVWMFILTLKPDNWLSCYMCLTCLHTNTSCRLIFHNLTISLGLAPSRQGALPILFLLKGITWASAPCLLHTQDRIDKKLFYVYFLNWFVRSSDFLQYPSQTCNIHIELFNSSYKIITTYTHV